VSVLAVRNAIEIEAALPIVVEHLAADGLIAYPTETVYGFGGAVTPHAVAALRRLKRRDAQRPFLLLVDGPDQAPGVQWTTAARTVARIVWPGPVTLALAAEPAAFPEGIVSEDGRVALRASPHPFVRALLSAWGGAVTSTSANARGQAPATDASAVAAALRDLDVEDVLVLDGGPLPPSAPSTIVAIDDDRVRVLRAGAVSQDALRNQLSGTGINVR
jgi:L-threonylcarbamoyladenylate synthase